MRCLNSRSVNQTTLVGLLSGSMILAVGVNLFIVPHNLAFGGVTGLTIIIQSLTGLPIFLSNLILSTIVMLLGRRVIGRDFFVKTIIPTVVTPIFMFATAPLSKFAPGLAISAICGPITVGFGVGLVIVTGGSTAGSDTVALALEKRFEIPVARSMRAIDAIIILCGWKVYGLKTALYSVVVAVIMSEVVKGMRLIGSEKTFFRYWCQRMRDGIMRT